MLRALKSKVKVCGVTELTSESEKNVIGGGLGYLVREGIMEI